MEQHELQLNREKNRVVAVKVTLSKSLELLLNLFPSLTRNQGIFNFGDIKNLVLRQAPIFEDTERCVV